jgi:hypothetical protein
MNESKVHVKKSLEFIEPNKTIRGTFYLTQR